MSHTPGPWKARLKYNTMGPAFKETARACRYRVFAGNPPVEVIFWGQGTIYTPDKRMVADAYLVAAAPEMLTILKEIAGVKITREMENKIYTVIAKTKGKV